jgi:PBP1b-binding outer membrane lipoprotein LpoB
MRSLFLVALVLVGCGEEDKDTVTKAVEVASQTAAQLTEETDVETMAGVCKVKDDNKPLSRQDLQKMLPPECDH